MSKDEIIQNASDPNQLVSDENEFFYFIWPPK